MPATPPLIKRPSRPINNLRTRSSPYYNLYYTSPGPVIAAKSPVRPPKKNPPPKMIVQNLPVTASQRLVAQPLTRAGFAAFGEVLSNPAPEARPSATPPEMVAATLPCGAVPANQGTAIQYRDLASLGNWYAQAPSEVEGTPRMTMFVCSTRELLPSSSASSSSAAVRDAVEVKVLERHPFTTQTFIPLTADPSKRYLVIVAPSLPPGVLDEGLPVPVPALPAGGQQKPLPGRGMPDIGKLQAFVATGEQAVTYGAGTWHAPMVALGPPDSTVDFLVFQFANGTALEDCQEVGLESSGAGTPNIMATIPASYDLPLAKL